MAGSTWKQRAVLLGVPAVCAPLALLWLYFAPVEPWTVFLGRFHPVVLHLPIGVLGLTAMMESLNLMSFGRLRLSTGVPLFVGAASAVVAMTLGVLLMGGEHMEGSLVLSHLRWGIATAALAVVTLALRCWPHHDTRPGLRKLYLAALFGTCGVMTFASHQGASITHGETYLTDHLPWKAEPGSSAEDRALAAAFLMPAGGRLAYDHLIAPIFAGKCYDCHNTRSFKGRLVMDSAAGLMKGGETGPAVVPGSVEESLTLVRVHLPLADEDHMPPAGDPQLTDAETRLLTWWVEQGAPFDKAVGDLEGHADRLADIDTVTAGLSAALATGAEHGEHGPSPEDVAAARRDFVDAVKQLQADHPGAVRYLDARSAGLEVASFGRPWSDDDTADLAAVAPQIHRLVLPRSTLSERSAAVLNQMPALERIDLRGAAVGDAFVAALNPPNLRELNLFGTRVTDAAAPALADRIALTRLNLGSTSVSTGVVQQLRRQLPGCEIRHAAPALVPDPPRASDPPDEAPDDEDEDQPEDDEVPDAAPPADAPEAARPPAATPGPAPGDPD